MHRKTLLLITAVMIAASSASYAARPKKTKSIQVTNEGNTTYYYKVGKTIKKISSGSSKSFPLKGLKRVKITAGKSKSKSGNAVSGTKISFPTLSISEVKANPVIKTNPATGQYTARTMALTSPSVALGQDVRRLDQGVNWTSRDWNTFYTTDQGSQIMPYSWMEALREPNGGLFLRDSMTRYGFLPNDKSVSNPEALPVGFLVASHNSSTKNFSITCAACHTREITVNETNFRIDGGPAFINMYAFMNDMIQSVDHLLNNELAFRNFQRAVKTPSAELRDQLQQWYDLNYLVVGQQLPPQSWGVARLDALNLILNRGTGGNIGEPSANYLIPANVAVADKPVRYPFLWNSDKQDLTQWAGTTVNGNKQYAMSRNTGEVCGVFGFIHPVGGTPPTDFLAENSVNFSGLAVIGDLTPKIGPPKYPWRIDTSKASLGGQLYQVHCASCHGIEPGNPRPPVYDTWRTQVQAVGTDSYYWQTLNRTAPSSGVLTGFVFGNNTVAATGAASIFLVKVLNSSALMQRFPSIDLSINPPAHPSGSYESRVLHGIWAAAPYLHNGSVPTLAELLKPSAERVTSFKVGRNYDIENIGLATTQPLGSTDFENTGLGNSNAGHEFGTTLSASDKEALLEYLKSL
jgi:hypothetical protein